MDYQAAVSRLAMRLAAYLVILMSAALAACSPVPLSIENKWAATNYFDEFTETTVCRVQQGTPQERLFLRRVNKTYFAYYFVVENHEGELRVGIQSEPIIPLVGDVQIKVGDRLFWLGYEDVPIDIAPRPAFTLPEDFPGLTPEVRSVIEQNAQSIQKMSSPYRHLIGEDARELLMAVFDSETAIKFRVIGTNSILSKTATVGIDNEFREALRECGIDSKGELDEHHKA